MGSALVGADELADAIVAAVGEYTADVCDGIPRELDEIARAAVKDLRSSSPSLTGDYAKGWRVKKERGRGGGESRVIHNATDYQLTHLLEHGHANRDGGRTSARPHIGAVADAHGAKLSANLARLVVTGGRA